MTKKRSRCLFILFAILLVVCLVATFVNFSYPFSVKGNFYSYSNFVNNLKLGEDVGKGYRITYAAELPDNELASNYDHLLNSTAKELKEIIQNQGFKDVTVLTTDNKESNIIVQVGNIINEEDESEIVSLIGDLSKISFSMSSDSSKAFATAEDVESIETKTQVADKTYYYVRVNFKDSSREKLTEATKESGTLYILLGSNTIGQMDLEGSQLSNGYLDIFSSNFINEADANTYANKLKTGTFSLKLTLNDSSTITPSYGIGANVFLSIAIALFVIAGFVYLIVKYWHLGLIACFSMLFSICIGLFLLQSIPLVHINLGGIIAMLIAYVIAVDTVMVIFEKAKSHYNSDIKLHISLKMAQKETLFRTFVQNVLLFVSGFVCLFMPNMAVQSFGWVAMVLSLVSLFNALVLMRLFVKMYLPFNSNNGKKCNFNKGGKNV